MIVFEFWKTSAKLMDTFLVDLAGNSLYACINAVLLFNAYIPLCILRLWTFTSVEIDKWIIDRVVYHLLAPFSYNTPLRYWVEMVSNIFIFFHFPVKIENTHLSAGEVLVYSMKWMKHEQRRAFYGNNHKWWCNRIIGSANFHGLRFINWWKSSTLLKT